MVIFFSSSSSSAFDTYTRGEREKNKARDLLIFQCLIFHSFFQFMCNNSLIDCYCIRFFFFFFFTRMMNLSKSCSSNSSSCYFIDLHGNCLSNEMVLDLILKYVLPTYYEWICIILYVIVFIVGTIGNLLVIIVIQRNRSMRSMRNEVFSILIIEGFIFLLEQ